MKAWEEAGLHLHHTIVWVKPRAVLTRSHNSEWVEWAYAIDEDARTMGVLGYGEAREWRLRAVVLLDGPEPDWKLVEKVAY
jgi:hypothetical protein